MLHDNYTMIWMLKVLFHTKRDKKSYKQGMRNMNKNTPISICIITKNECDMLKQCLEHIKPYADASNHEIVIVDTGSTDNTVEMCKAFTDKIFYFEWINDFSAARNFAAQKASHDWILCIDSDEYVSTWDENGLQKHISGKINLIGNIIQSNTCGFGENQYLSNDRASRLYNRTEYHFCRPIHEQLEPYDANKGHHYQSVNIIADHMSYAGTPEELKAKSERNISMLKAELAKTPNDPYILFQLGQSYYMIEDYKTANYYYNLGLSEDVDPNLGYVSTMVVSYGYTLINLKQYDKALMLEGIYDTFGNRADFVFLMGLIYLNNGFIEEAIIQFNKATTFDFAKVEGANSYRAWYNLGVIYECTGHIDTAIRHYQKCGNYAPALKRLALLQK